MEDNGNMVVKILAIVLITILGINVYRTEKTNQIVSSIAEKVDSLNTRLDSLEQIKTPNQGASLKAVNKKVADISNAVARLESKVEKLSSTKQQAAATAPRSATSSAPSPKTSSTMPTNGTKVRVAVSAKVKVENRYVLGSTPLPKVTYGPTGVVVINVVVNRVGTVGSVSVNTNTTINDEDVIDACKEAALRTEFAYNSEAPDKTQGFIAYTFTAK